METERFGKAKSRAKRHKRVKLYLAKLEAASKGDEGAVRFVMNTHTPAAVRAKMKKELAGPSKKMRAEFYKSREWASLRYDTLTRFGGICQCCGSSARDGAALRVDHIQSLWTNWHRRLDPTNVQPLCNLCNWGKGGFDQTDWRFGEQFPTKSDGRG